MYPCVRPGPAHAHMCPRLFAYLKQNNFEKKEDRFGRKPATFYKNWCRQVDDRKPDFARKLNNHGFAF
jgi:hypothetical protein